MFKKLAVVSIFITLLSACESGLDGKYSDKSGLMEYTFEPSGTAYIGMMGVVSEVQYEIDVDKLKIITSDGKNLVMTLNEDGSISGPKNLLSVRLI